MQQQIAALQQVLILPAAYVEMCSCTRQLPAHGHMLLCSNQSLHHAERVDGLRSSGMVGRAVLEPAAQVSRRASLWLEGKMT